MIVKFLNAHQYRGERTDHPVHPAIPRHRYLPGDLVDVPADYFERFLEPYPFAVVHNAAAAAEGAAAAVLDEMPIEQLRQLVEKFELGEEVVGTGESGRALKGDLVAVLNKHFKSVGRTVADEDRIPDDATLARMRVDELTTLCEARGIEVTGTGHDGKVLKRDMVEVLSEQRESEDDE